MYVVIFIGGYVGFTTAIGKYPHSNSKYINSLTNTKGKKMAREDHTYVAFENPLIEAVDSAVETLRLRGSQKYPTRKAFCSTAINRLLDKEGIKRKEIAA